MSDTVPMPPWMRDDYEKFRRQQKSFVNNVKNSKFVQNLKQQFEENPVAVILATAAVLGAGAKLISAWSHGKGSRAYARQVNYRISKAK